MPTPIMCLINFLAVLIISALAILGIKISLSPLHGIIAYGIVVVSFIIGYQYIGNFIYSRPKKIDEDAILEVTEVTQVTQK
jgi:hypothetical protein